MDKNGRRANKGEWSELYAFVKLLSEGRIYAADENVERLENVYFPIIKLIREEIENEVYHYAIEDGIKIYKNDVLIDEISLEEVSGKAKELFNRIFEGKKDMEDGGAFEIAEMNDFMDKMHITKITAPSKEKVDMMVQVHDTNTGYNPIVGFSVKSDIGSAPTLLNAGKNTRIQYEVKGLTKEQMDEINRIDKTFAKNYMIVRMEKLFKLAKDVVFCKVKDKTFHNNLVMIDSLLPEIYGQMILYHYRFISNAVNDCNVLAEMLCVHNTLNYSRDDVYKYKIKKLISAAALGMTPGKVWDGLDAATGGYIIIKKDGDVVCYHLYNRNFFEEYLMKNTQFDRPSATRHDYGYVYEEDGKFYVDLNVQIRFKSVKAGNKPINANKGEERIRRLTAYYKALNNL